MSAFICSDEHINYLVNAHLMYCTRGLDPRELVPMGEMLRIENERSVQYRYPSDAIDHLPYTEYTFRIVRRLEPVQVLKALQCFEYQACEHAAWETSEAKRWCERLASAAISKLSGYEASAWAISDWQPKTQEQRAGEAYHGMVKALQDVEDVSAEMDGPTARERTFGLRLYDIASAALKRVAAPTWEQRHNKVQGSAVVS